MALGVITMDNEVLEPEIEKRMNERSGYKGIIKWSYFNQNNYFGGELLNFSQQGFYFETSKAIRTGAHILIQLKKFFPENLSSNDKELLRNVCIGEVKHCNEILKNDSTSYGVGIKYISQR
jgi:hypothetical protein